jgi:UTP--glucose-1-phosphate uridylyltransferase
VKPTIRKAVFPAAGLGTRFLPATKAQPKEMLPLVDKPIIQYGVEEAVASGREHHPRHGPRQERHRGSLRRLGGARDVPRGAGQDGQLEEIRKISNMINVAYVRQGEPLGLGHAVLVARELVGDEPFAVILGDDVIDADAAGAAADDRRLPQVDGPVLAVERVPRDEVSSYGIIAIDEGRVGPGRLPHPDMVEKPPRKRRRRTSPSSAATS